MAVRLFWHFSSYWPTRITLLPHCLRSSLQAVTIYPIRTETKMTTKHSHPARGPRTALKLLAALLAAGLAGNALAIGGTADIQVYDRSAGRQLPVYFHEGK